jgi:hypothetical protein
MSFLRGATRPQAMLWSDNAGTLDSGYYFPNGNEGEDFIIVSDHNRSEINIAPQRIETRQRMINANMRSYWTADKLSISCSWSRLPSRPFSGPMTFDEEGQPNASYTSYTADGAAGGVDMLNWYESHPGSFYLFLSYDKYRLNGIEDYNKNQTYSQIIKVYFASFDYGVEKRSGANFDFWNISLTLEEV